MTKSIALLARRADLTRAQFHDYYESRHAPLAIGYFAFAKYVRNHLSDHDSIGFDTISEFWNEDIARLAALMQTPVGDIMRTDEQRFMDRSAIRSGGSREWLLAGSPRAIDSSPRTKHAWLIERAPGMSPDAFADSACAWGRTLATACEPACERVTLDVISPWPGANFPFDAILWFWMRPGEVPRESAAPEGLVRRHSLNVVSQETPPGVMAAALRTQTPSG